eukprot:Skav207069  [mRNA]  locus=scaffold1909:119319:120514:- [translate_table: standard]
MAQNKSKGLSGALSMTEFPLTTMSLKPFLRETLLPFSSSMSLFLKRSILFLFGNNALYVRLPSERKDAIVHRIDVEAVHQDLLADRDKPLYGKYKGGVMETGPTFDADVQKEQDMIEKGVASMIEHDQIQTYVELANGKLQDKLLFHGATFLPASAASSNSEDPGSPMHVCPPVPPIGTTPCGRRQKKFVYPERRLRAKTSPTQELEQLAQDAEAADEGLKDEETPEPMDVQEPVSMDLEADEEAASHMGLTGF